MSSSIAALKNLTKATAATAATTYLTYRLYQFLQPINIQQQTNLQQSTPDLRSPSAKPKQPYLLQLLPLSKSNHATTNHHVTLCENQNSAHASFNSEKAAYDALKILNSALTHNPTISKTTLEHAVNALNAQTAIEDGTRYEAFDELCQKLCTQAGHKLTKKKFLELKNTVFPNASFEVARDAFFGRRIQENRVNAAVKDLESAPESYKSLSLDTLHQLQHSFFDKNIQPNVTIDSNNIAINQRQCTEHSMEDYFYTSTIQLLEGEATLYSLYDGHGGDHVAKYVAQEFPNLLETIFSDTHKANQLPYKTGRDPKQPGQLMIGIEEVFKQMAEELVYREERIEVEIKNIRKKPISPHITDQKTVEQCYQLKLKEIENLMHKKAWRTGCTALVIVNYQNRVFIFHSGDTRASLIMPNKTSLALTLDHKPEEPKVYRRIARLGGEIDREDESAPYRVNAYLAVGRAFGDLICHAVQPIPTVTELPPCQADYILMASDGLHDVIPSWSVGVLLGIFDDVVSGAMTIEQATDQILSFMSSLSFADLVERRSELNTDRQGLTNFLTTLKTETQTQLADSAITIHEIKASQLTQMAFYLGSTDDITVVLLPFKSGSLKESQWHQRLLPTETSGNKADMAS